MTYSQPTSRRVGRAAPVGLEEAATARSADLLEALVAAYALMAHADGEVAPAERRRLFETLRESPTLSIFRRHEIVDHVANHEANFRLDPELAQLIACERLGPIIGHPAAVRAVLALCRALIPADGIAHPAEYRALATIKTLLGVSDDPRAVWSAARTA